MRVVDRAEPLEGDDVGAGDGADRCRARPDGAAADDRGAGAALSEPAAEFRAVQTEVVAEHVQERGGRVDVNAARTSVHVELDDAHGGASYAG